MAQVSSVSTALRAMGHALLDLLFPLRCIGCGKEGSLLCPDCCQSMLRIEEPFCHRCGKPLHTGESHSHIAGLNIDGIRSVFYYEGITREAILAFKYKNLKAMGAPLGRFLAEKLSELPACDAIVPVPLHYRRLRQRGYNQSSLLAREVARVSGLALVEDSLVRQRNTPPQARSSSSEERQANVADAFACRDRQLQGKRVIILDDVFTTGATLSACAAAVKAAGAASVWGLTVAAEV